MCTNEFTNNLMSNKIEVGKFYKVGKLLCSQGTEYDLVSTGNVYMITGFEILKKTKAIKYTFECVKGDSLGLNSFMEGSSVCIALTEYKFDLPELELNAVYEYTGITTDILENGDLIKIVGYQTIKDRREQKQAYVYDNSKLIYFEGQKPTFLPNSYIHLMLNKL